MSNEKLREKLIDMCNCYGIGNARTTLDKVMSKEKDPKLIVAKVKSIIKRQIESECTKNEYLYFSRECKVLFSNPSMSNEKRAKILNSYFSIVGPLSDEKMKSYMGRFPIVKKLLLNLDEEERVNYPSLVPFYGCIEKIKNTDYGDYSNIDFSKYGEANLALMRRIESGDSDTISKLLEVNMPLVYRAANMYFSFLSSTVDYDDLIQFGSNGLLHSIETFDLSRDTSFSTYATWWIRQAVSRGIADTGRSVRVPVHRVLKNGRIARGISSLELELGRRPTESEILEKLNISRNDYLIYRETTMPVVSINKKIDEDDVMTLEDLLVCDDNVDESVISGMQKDFLVGVLNDKKTLDSRQHLIITERLGLDGKGIRTLEEIGRQLGCTRERVRQIEAKALKKVRKAYIATLFADNENKGLYLSLYSTCGFDTFKYLAYRTGIFGGVERSHEEVARMLQKDPKELEPIQSRALTILSSREDYAPVLEKFDNKTKDEGKKLALVKKS